MKIKFLKGKKKISALKISKTILILSLFIIPLALPLINIPNPKRKPIDSDTALNYLYELEYYIEESGNTDICLYFIEYMNDKNIEDFTKCLNESYNNGYQNAYDEVEGKISETQANAYEEGWTDGYEQGYKDNASNLPYNNSIDQE